MNYCVSCGKSVQEGIKFCPHCGAKQGEEAEGTSQSINTEEMKEKISSGISTAKVAIQKSGYINYLKKTATRPSIAIETNEKNYGLIQLIVLSVMTTLSVYLVIRGLVSYVSNQSGLGSLFSVDSYIMSSIRSAIVPRVLIASVFIYGLFIVASFVSLKIMAKNAPSFMVVLSQLGGLLTPNILIVTLASLLSLIFATETVLMLSTVIIGWSILLCFAAYNYFIFNSVKLRGIDSFYVLLISNIVVLLLFSLVIYSQVEPIITMIDDLSRYGW